MRATWRNSPGVFNAAAEDKLRTADLRPVLEVDRMLELHEVNQDLLASLRRAGPFGQENPEPVWGARRLRALDCRILRERHLKLTLSDGETRLDAIGFNMAEKLPHGPVDAAFTLKENHWSGNTNLQLHLKDIRPALKD